MAINPNDPNNPNLPPGTPKVRLEDIMDVQDAQQKLTAIFRNSIDALEDESKEAFKKITFGIDKVVEKELKRAEDVHKQFLKVTLSSEKFHIEELKKDRDDLIQKIKDEAITERNLIIGGIKDKKAREEAYAQHKIKTSQKVAQVEAAFSKKIGQETLRATAAQFAFGEQAANAMIKYGTKANLILLVLSGIVSALTKVLGLSREFAAVEVAFRGAGLGGTTGVAGGGRLTGDVGRIFSSIQSAFRSAQVTVDPDDIRKYMVGLAEAPKALKDIDAQGAGQLVEFAGAMQNIGIEFEDTVKIMVGASNDLNMSTKRLSETYKTAVGVSIATGVNAKTAFQTLLNLNGVLRGLTFNAEEAAKVLVSTAIPLEKLGFSNMEIQKFAQNLAGVLGQMSPSKMAGILGFIKGRMPTREELMNEGGLEAFADFFKSVLKDFDKGSSEYIFAIESLAKEVGLTAATTMKGAEGWASILDQMDEADAEGRKSLFDAFQKQFAPTEEQMLDIQRKGLQAMTDLKSPMEQLGDKIEEFSESFLYTFMPLMRELNQSLAKLVSWLPTRSEAQDKIFPRGFLGDYSPRNPTEARFNKSYRNLPYRSTRRMLESGEYKIP